MTGTEQQRKDWLAAYDAFEAAKTAYWATCGRLQRGENVREQALLEGKEMQRLYADFLAKGAPFIHTKP